MVMEIIKLLKADVAEEVILAYIEKKGAPEELSASRIVDLKKAGATKGVLMALLGAEAGIRMPGRYPFDLDENHEVGEPATRGLMAVFPILRKTPATVGEYLTLDEAMGRKVIKIEEKGGGSVPVVIIINTGRLPIYISAGEVIIGGKQDRMISHDIVILPGKEVTVDVKCVEKGRWHGPRVHFESAQAMGGLAARKAVQFAGQSEVWDEVAAQNVAAGAESSTGSYKAALTDPDVKRRYRELAEAMLPHLEGRRVVGMVVAVNGKVHAIEMFGSPALFSRMKEKLLKSYVLDTLGMQDQHANPPDKEAILSFYRSTMKERAEELKKYKENTNFKREAREATANDCVDAQGQLLHRSLLAH